MSYKKRGQAGYTGKKEAKSKVSRERNYAKEEIRQELKEMEEGDENDYDDENGNDPKRQISIKSLAFSISKH